MVQSYSYARPSNSILTALPATQLQRLSSVMRPALAQGQVLHQEGERLQYVYFLDKGLVSLVLNSTCGHSVEVGMVGYEGMIGVYGIGGVHRAFTQAVVQVNGRGWRLPLEALHHELNGQGVLRNLALQHLELLHIQAAQTALCNRLHSIEERLCRWLLMACDCTGSDSLPLTHENISSLLGVRRSSITIAAHELQEKQLIRYTRGSIQLRNRDGLAHKACSCHGILHQRFNHIHTASQKLREYAA